MPGALEIRPAAMGTESTDELFAPMRCRLEQASRLAATASPEALDQSRPLLEEVRVSLERLRQDPPAVPRLAARFLGLRRDLERFSALLESASRFHDGWARLRGCLTGGYDARGEPAAAEPPRRVSVDG